MFIPCDHCLRRNATRRLHVTEAGRREVLRLCAVCYEKENRGSFFSPAPAPGWPSEEEIAQELQATLIPAPLPRLPGYDLSAYFRPARSVGGDYYDYLEIDNHRVGILVADVCGSGLPGMLVQTETRALMWSEAPRSPSPADTLARVNRLLHKSIRRGMFVTMFYTVLDLDQAEMTCVSAGHNPMVHWRKETGAVHLVDPPGIALGFDPGSIFEKTIREQRIQLSPGDRFAVFTDGIVEAMNEDKEEFGQSRLCLRMKQLSELGSAEFLQRLAQEVDLHVGDAPQHDDMAIVTARYEGKP